MLYFIDFALLCNAMSETRSRLALIDLISDFFKKCTSEDARIVAYLLHGSLDAPFKQIPLNIADKFMLSLFIKLSNYTLEKAKEQFELYGAWPIVFENNFFGSRDASRYSLLDIYNMLKETSFMGGDGVIEAKKDLLLILLKNFSLIEQKYFVGLLIGNLYINVLDKTILQACAKALHATKEQKKLLEKVYYVQSDLGYVIEYSFSYGLEKISLLQHPVIGIPIQCATAERMDDPNEILEECSGKAIVQPKFDGLRLQIHCREKDVFLFSRNHLLMNNMFPELIDCIKSFVKLRHVKNVIFDGEIIAYDQENDKYKSFQETVKRRRKHDVDLEKEKNPIRVLIFDILFLNDQSLIDLPYETRLEYLGVLFPESYEHLHLIESEMYSSADDLQNYYLSQVCQGFEGIMIKNPQSPYHAGKRDKAWIKWKRVHETSHLKDTIDAVILGYYHGKGKRIQNGIGAILIGLFEEKTNSFATLAKVGTGMDDATWKQIKRLLDHDKILEKPHNIYCHKNLYPDIWVNPRYVVSVTADEVTRSPVHTLLKNKEGKGLALRFPRLVAIVTDKDINQLTKPEELIKL